MSRVETGDRTLTIDEATLWASACGCSLRIVDASTEDGASLWAGVPASCRPLAGQLLRILSDLRAEDRDLLHVMATYWESRNVKNL